MKIRREVHFKNRVVCAYEERAHSVQDLVMHAIRNAPEGQVAVSDRTATIAYDQLWAEIDGYFEGTPIVSLPEGARVVLAIDNRVDFPLAFLGCLFRKLIPVPVGTRLRTRELEHIVRDSGADAAVVEPNLAPYLREATCETKSFTILVVGNDVRPGRKLSPRSDVQKLETWAHDAHDEDATMCLLYTSGTTGVPKGAMITHFGCIHSALHWREAFALKQGMRTVLAIPASHIAGLAGVVIPFLFISGHIHFVDRFSADEMLGKIADLRAEHALMVPAMYNLCTRSDVLGQLDLSAWKIGCFGGAPMPVSTIEALARQLPDLQLRNAYGATETTSPATIMPLSVMQGPTDSIGKTVPCGEIVVVDEHDRELPPGDVGELLIGGPMVVPGYWNNPEADAQSFVSGFWRSGDIGSVDPEGYVRIHDRKKHMINRGGFKVFPAELEDALMSHPDVLEAAAFGYEDPVLGEKTHAVLRLTEGSPGLELDQVRAYLGQRLADYKLPDRLSIHERALPRNANGKTQKDVLKEEYSA